MSLAQRFWPKISPEPNTGCWLWAGAADEHGYGKIGQQYHHEPDVKAHRAAWMLTKGPIPDGLQVCHKCDVPSCVNPDHLFLGTFADNMDDKVAKGRQQKGERHWNSKLTVAQVRSIRERRAAGDKLVQIASEFGVDFSTVGKIAKRTKWAWVS